MRSGTMTTFGRHLKTWLKRRNAAETGRAASFMHWLTIVALSAAPFPWAPAALGQSEVCNGLDDDGDGDIDEDFTYPLGHPTTGDIIFVGIGQHCTARMGDCSGPGQVACSPDGASAICVPVEPTDGPYQEGPAEDLSCFDWHDNDCDGLVDHADPDCRGPEACDGFDNDFDGMVDEDFPQLGQPCSVGEGICRNTGIYVCASNGSGAVCSAQPYAGAQEGPPLSAKCSDGLDNDCDGRVDMLDPDCLGPEICDGFDNDGNGSIDEGFVNLGQPCTVGQGPCQRQGVYVCRLDGTGTICSVTPGAPEPEGPAGCDCADGIDNDCDGLIDINDPDCGSNDLRVRAALPIVSVEDDDCSSFHRVAWETVGGTGTPDVVARLVAIDSNGTAVRAGIALTQGEYVRLTSRGDPAELEVRSADAITIDDSYFERFLPCMAGPDQPIPQPPPPLPTQCKNTDFDFDGDVDMFDFAFLQAHLGETLRRHYVVAPSPALRVEADDGLNNAVAYASTVPHVVVWEPRETVVSIPEGDRTRVVASIPNIELASLQLSIDGADVLSALGIDPATDFPGGPYGGGVALPNNCAANICQLVVETGGVEELAGNTLTMFVDNACCGGHSVVLSGSPIAGTYPLPPLPGCNPPMDEHYGVSHGLDIRIDTPSDGETVPVGPTTVTGEVCHGQSLSPDQSSVRLNGLPTPFFNEEVIPGNGPYPAETYKYTFATELVPTELLDDFGGIQQLAGTLDPGPNRLTATVQDNATFRSAHREVKLSLGPSVGGSLRGAMPIPNGLTLAFTPSGIETTAGAVLDTAIPAVVGQMAGQWIGELHGRTFTFTTPFCDPTLTVLTDTATLSVAPFNYVATLANDQLTLTATSPTISAQGRVGGHCKVTFLGICIFEIFAETDILIEVNSASVSTTATETQLETGQDFELELNVNPNNIVITVGTPQADLGCIVGAIIELLSLEDDVEDLLQGIAQDFIDDLDLGDWLDQLEIEPIDIDEWGVGAVNLPGLNVDLDYSLTDVEITPQGMSVAFQTEFTPLQVNNEIPPTPGSLSTAAPLPQPPIPSMERVAAMLSDDALNQLLYALTRNGLFKTEYEDVRLAGDFLPADCTTLPGTEAAVCTALKNASCNVTFPAGPVRDACNTMNILFAELDVDETTPLILRGRIDQAPKLFITDRVPPSLIQGHIRLSQMSVGIVADRDGNGRYEGSFNSVPSCFGGNPATITDCTLWETCLNVNLQVELILGTTPAGNPKFDMAVVGIDLSTGHDCGGGSVQPPDSTWFDTIANGAVVALLTSQIEQQMPPLVFEGLDFQGLITLQNLSILTVENDGEPDFRDYGGITFNPAN